MNEQPILFRGEMVRALLDGRKTQTRRTSKELNEIPSVDYWEYEDGSWFAVGDLGMQNGLAGRVNQITCPYGQPGDRLWVRETCRAVDLDSGFYGVLYPANRGFRKAASEDWSKLYAYRGGQGFTVPAIHAPRWTSRITLELTGVRVERIQDIGKRDAIAEGMGDDEFLDWRDEALTFAGPEVHIQDEVDQYRALWDNINYKRGYGWDANPFVWVLSFRVISDFMVIQP